MDAFVGEIRAFGFNYTPQGWLACDGTVYNIGQFQALASLLGSYFGGDGRTTFGVPNLTVRIPFGAGLSDYGQPCQFSKPDGASTVTLQSSNLPQHTHAAVFTPTATTALNVNVAVSTATTGQQPSPKDNYLAPSDSNVETYALPTSTPTVNLAGTALTVTGTGTVVVQPAGAGVPVALDLLPSHVAMKFCICYEGLYPTRP